MDAPRCHSAQPATEENNHTLMKLLISIAAIVFVGGLDFLKPSAASADSYTVTPSLLNNGGYTINGPNGYRGTYSPSLLNNGGGTYRDSSGRGYTYSPSLLNNGGGTYNFH